MRALITGFTGFVGPFLGALLLDKGFDVIGLGLQDRIPAESKNLATGLTVISNDIRDYSGLRQILETARPDHVYHLAAVSNVVASFDDPRRTFDINVGGTLNLFEALREIGLKPRIVNVSTAHVYRSIDSEAGLLEDAAIRLLTPYAASKFMCESLAAQYVASYGFDIVTARPFNHIGPGQPAGFVCADFAKQIASIRLGHADPVLRVGDLTPVRDFTDVRDTVEAYWILATHGIPGEIYNVSSHNPVSIRQIVAILCELAEVDVQIETDRTKLRPIETLRLFGNSSKLRTLGWEPRIPLKRTLSDVLDYWLSEMDGRLIGF